MERIRQPEVKPLPDQCCGTCHWNRAGMQFGQLKPVCRALPRSPFIVGNTMVTIAPVIEDERDECSLWKPKVNG